MHVLKFGGTSMGDEHTWRRVLQIIERYDKPIVIVSATARTTRQLIAAAELALTDYEQAILIAREIRERHQLLIKNFMSHFDGKNTEPIAEQCDEWIEMCIDKLKNYLTNIVDTGYLHPKTQDAVASIGEQLSSRLFSRCASAFGLNSAWVDACEIIKTDSEFGSANPDFGLIQKSVKKISDHLNNEYIPVMGGYYGEDTGGNITTLGFEGSDYSASLVGSALDAEAIEIWTDVSGIYTCDPRVVESAYPIKELSFREATEMAYFGAKVLHPSTMNPAEEKQIPVLVKNIFEPDHPGTKIQGEAPAGGLAKAMTFLHDIAIISVTSPHTQMGYEFLSGVFSVLKGYHLPVNVVTTTEASVSVALKAQKISPEVINSLKHLGDVTQTTGQGIVSFVGCNFKNAGTIGKIMSATISEQKITMLSYSRTKQNFNIVLDESDLLPAVKTIHKKVFQTP